MIKNKSFLRGSVLSFVLVGVMLFLASGSSETGDSDYDSFDADKEKTPREQCVDAWPAIAEAINNRREKFGMPPSEGMMLISEERIKRMYVRGRDGVCVFDYSTGAPVKFVEKKSGIGKDFLWEFADKQPEE